MRGIARSQWIDWQPSASTFTGFRSLPEVTILVRRPLNIKASKAKRDIIDFENSKQLKDTIPNNPVVFCCMGTTRKKSKGRYGCLPKKWILTFRFL